MVIAALGVQAVCVMAACLVPFNEDCVLPGASEEKDQASGEGSLFPLVTGTWFGDLRIAPDGCTVPSSKDANPDEQGNLGTGPVLRTCTATANLTEVEVFILPNTEQVKVETEYAGASSIVGNCTTEIPGGDTCIGGNAGS